MRANNDQPYWVGFNPFLRTSHILAAGRVHTVADGLNNMYWVN